MEFAMIISGLLANWFTSLVKPAADKRYLTLEDQDARKVYIRGLNAFFGLVVLGLSSYLLGETPDLTTVKGMFEALASVAVTFSASQGGYLLYKKG